MITSLGDRLSTAAATNSFIETSLALLISEPETVTAADAFLWSFLKSLFSGVERCTRAYLMPSIALMLLANSP